MWLRRRPRWRHSDELVAFLRSLAPVRLGDTYTEQDRAQDFMAVFNGNSTAEQGQRVLFQIATICDPVRREDPDNHGALAYRAGMRRVMQEIQRCFVVNTARQDLRHDDWEEADDG